MCSVQILQLRKQIDAQSWELSLSLSTTYLSFAYQWIYHQTYGRQLIYITMLSWFYPVKCLNREIITSLLEKNNACTLVLSPCEYHWTKVKLRLENLQKNDGQKPQLWQTIFIFYICWFDIRICDKSHP